MLAFHAPGGVPRFEFRIDSGLQIWSGRNDNAGRGLYAHPIEPVQLQASDPQPRPMEPESSCSVDLGYDY